MRVKSRTRMTYIHFLASFHIGKEDQQISERHSRIRLVHKACNNVRLYLYTFTLVVYVSGEETNTQSFYLYIKPSRSFREKRWKVCAPRSLPFLIRFSVSRSSSCRRNFSCAKIARSLIQLMDECIRTCGARQRFKQIVNFIYIYIFFLSFYLTSPRKQMGLNINYDRVTDKQSDEFDRHAHK